MIYHRLFILCLKKMLLSISKEVTGKELAELNADTKPDNAVTDKLGQNI